MKSKLHFGLLLRRYYLLTTHKFIVKFYSTLSSTTSSIPVLKSTNVGKLCLLQMSSLLNESIKNRHLIHVSKKKTRSYSHLHCSTHTQNFYGCKLNLFYQTHVHVWHAAPAVNSDYSISFFSPQLQSMNLLIGLMKNFLQFISRSPRYCSEL